MSNAFKNTNQSIFYRFLTLGFCFFIIAVIKNFRN
ncbi:DUF6095 family protein [Muriicola sp.]